MAIEDPFPAFEVTADGDDVSRRVTTLAPGDLPDGAVTIEVTWSSVNYKDALASSPNGRVAQISPLVPGIDLAGTVIESADPEAPVGQEVLVTGRGLGVAQHGGWARYARVPAGWALPIPDGLSLRDSMILGTAGLTAGLSIDALERHGIRPGDGSVLVLGATGGVGSVAVGALSGAGYEVSAITGKADAEGFLRELGAAEVLPRETLEDGVGRPLAKMRWAACVDPIGGAGTTYALRTTRYGGAIATSGLTAGVALETTVLPLILRAVSLLGIDSVEAGNELRRHAWKRLATDLRFEGLESLANEVTLETLEPTLAQLLAGAVRGRTIVRLG